MKNFINTRPFLFVILVWLLMVVIRTPQLNRPLSKNYEFNSASVLITLHEWNKTTPWQQGFIPRQYFSGLQNTFYSGNSFAKTLEDSGSYLSMGPGSFLLPWFCFKIFGVQPSSVAINYFAAVLGLFAAFVFYLLALFYFNQYGNIYKAKYNAAISTVVFLLLPVNLWYFGNAYCHEVAVIPFLLLSCYAYCRLVFDNVKNKTAWLALLFIAVFTGIWADWVLLIFAFIAFVFTFIFKTNMRLLWHVRICLTLSVITGLGGIIYLYSQAIGTDNLWLFIQYRFFARAPHNDVGKPFFGIPSWLFFIAISIGALLLALAFINKKNVFNTRVQKIILYLLLLPALIHTAALFNFANEHSYSLLKAAPYFTLLLTPVIINYKKPLHALLMLCVLQLCLYEIINLPGKKSVKGLAYADYKLKGEQLKTIPQDGYIFLENDNYYHQISWYAKRTYYSVQNKQEAEIVFRKQPLNKAYYCMFVNNMLEITELKKQE
jgi:hypothetical protein